MQSKIEIRRHVRALRQAIDPTAKIAAAGTVQAQLLAMEAIRGAKTWFTYVSSGSEVGTHELIHELLACGCTVAVPRVIGMGQMVPQHIRAFDELRLGEFGILSPPPGETFQGPIEVCVCPGVAFTERGERLGAGGGYYDRYLAAHRPRLAIGLAFECQLVGELPLELHDRRMDYIITEKSVIHSGQQL